MRLPSGSRARRSSQLRARKTSRTCSTPAVTAPCGTWPPTPPRLRSSRHSSRLASRLQRCVTRRSPSSTLVAQMAGGRSRGAGSLVLPTPRRKRSGWKVVPFLLEDRLVERGAHYRKARDFEPHIEVDERMVTGQNPASSAAVAECDYSLSRRGVEGSRVYRKGRTTDRMCLSLLYRVFVVLFCEVSHRFEDAL